jgi:hypothetical protein
MQLRDNLKSLPVRVHPEKENHWIYNNGRVEVLFEIDPINAEAYIHFFTAIDSNLCGKRTGVGREAMMDLRKISHSISAIDVGGSYEDGISQHPAFRFWRKMMEEGLIDTIVIYDVDEGRKINTSMLNEGPIVKDYGVIYPDADQFDVQAPII